MPGKGAVAAFVGTKVWLFSVAVHRMGLTFMTQQTSSRREAGILASLVLTPIGLKVRVDELAERWGPGVSGGRLQYKGHQLEFLLVVALELLWLMVAVRLALPWAVEQVVCLWAGVLVEVMIPSGLTFAA